MLSLLDNHTSNICHLFQPSINPISAAAAAAASAATSSGLPDRSGPMVSMAGMVCFCHKFLFRQIVRFVLYGPIIYYSRMEMLEIWEM